MISLTGAPLRAPETIEAMGRALRHRGPDGHALLESPDAILGTERLRVIDLDPRADQPFQSPDGQIWLACNGEIYNSPSIRARFPDYPFRSGSDVEPLIPFYRQNGARLVDDLDGMFGLAIWDRRSRTLLLARDRAGEKPLFFARNGNEVWFASEIQALLENPRVSRELDRDSVEEFLALGFVTEPRTIFRQIHRIEAGTIVTLREGEEKVDRYWDATGFSPALQDVRQAKTRLAELIESAVSKQVTSDVPVGVFVSGGLDSSILAALAARKLGPGRVHTISVEFVERSYDESGDAASFARALGSNHVSVRADEGSLTVALDEVIARIAEPIADPAVLPAFLLAKKAREHVTVILSGEGADELFGGYPTYLGHAFAPRFNRLPPIVKKSLYGLVRSLPSSSRKVPLEFLLKRFMDEAGRPWMERHLRWIGTRLLDGNWPVVGGGPQLFRQEIAMEKAPLAGAMLLDYKTYLRDNLLVKVDRATMLSSIEARAPYLDREVSAFGLSLDASLRVRGLTTKWILKQVATRWVDDAIIHRRKRGLSVPIPSWINGGLRQETDRLLAPGRIEATGVIDPSLVARLLGEHRAGTANHARSLWPLVAFEKWKERWV